MKLLEKIKSVELYRKPRRELNEEDIEVVVAWLRGDISYKQISKGKGIMGSDVYNYLSMGARELYRRGRITIK